MGLKEVLLCVKVGFTASIDNTIVASPFYREGIVRGEVNKAGI